MKGWKKVWWVVTLSVIRFLNASNEANYWGSAVNQGRPTRSLAFLVTKAMTHQCIRQAHKTYNRVVPGKFSHKYESLKAIVYLQCSWKRLQPTEWPKMTRKYIKSASIFYVTKMWGEILNLRILKTDSDSGSYGRSNFEGIKFDARPMCRSLTRF